MNGNYTLWKFHGEFIFVQIKLVSAIPTAAANTAEKSLRVAIRFTQISTGADKLQVSGFQTFVNTRSFCSFAGTG